MNPDGDFGYPQHDPSLFGVVRIPYSETQIFAVELSAKEPKPKSDRGLLGGDTATAVVARNLTEQHMSAVAAMRYLRAVPSSIRQTAHISRKHLLPTAVVRLEREPERESAFLAPRPHREVPYSIDARPAHLMDGNSSSAGMSATPHNSAETLYGVNGILTAALTELVATNRNARRPKKVSFRRLGPTAVGLYRIISSA